MYDPLTAPGPGRGLDHVASYWQATTDPGVDDGVFTGEAETDVVIIGAGYTGLSAAYYLRHNQGARVIVLEANRPGWGCSGRNGGFVTPSIGRLKPQDWITRFGTETARSLFNAALSSMATVREVIAEAESDCDMSSPGFLHVAHRANRLPALESQHQLLRRVFEFETELLSADDLKRDWFSGKEAFGALRDPVSFAVHPLKLALGLLNLARQSGAKIFSASPVISWQRHGEYYTINTPSGSVRAYQVLMATNGYSTEGLFPQIRGRILPVLSSIIVTRPMNPDEKSEAQFKTSDLIIDTRIVRPYYRRLSNDRIMFGCRGALRESSKYDRSVESNLLKLLTVKFPALKNITADYFWGGWVNVTYDFMPRIHRLSSEPGVVYAMGYNGSGVATAIQAGRWSASLLSGADDAIPAPLRSALKIFPLSSLRRQAQGALVSWYRLRDAC